MLQLKDKVMVLSLTASFIVFRNTENYDDLRNKTTQRLLMTEVMYKSMEN
jgi:hypothetical protein